MVTVQGKIAVYYTKFRRIFTAVSSLHISLYAAGAGFFIVVSLFPGLVLILSLLQYTSLEVGSLLSVLSPLLPDALEAPARELITSAYTGNSGMVVGLSALTSLWSASRGVYGLLTGLNAVYGVTERRGWLRTRLISMLYTLSFLLMLVVSLILHVFSTTALHLMPADKSPFLRFLTEASGLRDLMWLLALILFFCLVYRVLPDRRSSFWDCFPGALLAALGWLIFTDLFSLYVLWFPRYSRIFGSVYALALSMLWLYFCLSIVFYGGALNRWLSSRKNRT